MQVHRRNRQNLDHDITKKENHAGQATCDWRAWTSTLPKSSWNTSVRQRKLSRRRLRRGMLAEPVKEEGAGVSHQLQPLIVLLVFLLHHAVDLPQHLPFTPNCIELNSSSTAYIALPTCFSSSSFVSSSTLQTPSLRSSTS